MDMSVHMRRPAGAAADPSSTNAPIVVTLVHGTFAKGAPWTKDGSILRREIAAALGEHGRDVVFGTFDWSGRNTHKARITAGYELARHIRELRNNCRACKHFIVAHSHGGNVALLAHKHLPEEIHATGVATLGTPFIYAHLDPDLEQATEGGVRTEFAEGIVLNTLLWMLSGILAAVVFILSQELLQATSFKSIIWPIILGWATFSVLLQVLPPFVARLLTPWSPRLAAMKLGQALALKPMPDTHVLSFVYPGDEAGRLLNALELTTAMPTRAVKWFKEIAGVVGSVAFLIFILSAFFAEPITWATGIQEERLKNLAVSAMSGVLLGGFAIWFLLVFVRYVLSILRGHPAGFGWERPSIHAHVDIGVQPTAAAPQLKSNAHQEVPFTVADDARRGLRHSGLYEDKRILKALAYWMAHVK